MNRYAWILLAIVFGDITITVFGIYHGHIIEGNPVMAWYIQVGGLKLFIVIKIILTLLGMLIFEMLRLKKVISAHLLEQCYIATILLYLAVFAIGMRYLYEF